MSEYTRFIIAAYDHEYFMHCVIRQRVDRKQQILDEVVVSIHSKISDARIAQVGMRRTLVMSTEVT